MQRKLTELTARLSAAEGASKDALQAKEKVSSELDTAKRDLAQAQSKELTARASASKTEASLKEAVESKVQLQSELDRAKAEEKRRKTRH